MCQVRPVEQGVSYGLREKSHVSGALRFQRGGCVCFRPVEKGVAV